MPPEIELRRRSPRSYLMGLRSRLGKAAVIGGKAYVEHFVTSDEFAAVFHVRTRSCWSQSSDRDVGPHCGEGAAECYPGCEAPLAGARRLLLQVDRNCGDPSLHYRA
jgi:hypothetical protein